MALSPDDWVQNQTKQIPETGTTEGVLIFDRPIVLLTVRGAKSGQLRCMPVMRVEHDGSYAVVASKGCAPEHPAWFRQHTRADC
ncbi:nitroreductase/quinone reductase family protein [Lentzea chajnantorensis]